MTSRVQRIPKALLRRIGYMVDFIRYAAHASAYRRLLPATESSAQKTLLLVGGNGMNITWAQVWPILTLPIRMKGYRGLVFTKRSAWVVNAYFKLFGLGLLYMEDHAVSTTVPDAIAAKTSNANSLDSFKVITWNRAPVGQIALSTYSRNFGTGNIDFTDADVLAYIRMWIGRICNTMKMAEDMYRTHNVAMCFFTEVFMEEYGAFYYAALNAELNTIRFAGTVRDNAFIMQHLSHENDRIHHASIDKTTWAQLKQRTDDAQIETELMQNFQDRYGQKWHRSHRNHPNTQMVEIDAARSTLGIAPNRKVAVIYSHILYDTLFFFGTDLFRDYSEWLIETTRAAIANPHIDWLIKVHPSNLWRGEMDSLLKGKYEEERLIYDTFGPLPPHVRIVGADTKINPFTWFQLADYGITVRGTSGLEMAALGKTVVTAGTGRYEGNGFTVDPKTAAEYLDILNTLHTLPARTKEQQALAKRYAHALFVLKPYTLSSLRPCVRFGCNTVYASDDLVYRLTPLATNALPHDIAQFGEWALNSQDRDLLANA